MKFFYVIGICPRRKPRNFHQDPLSDDVTKKWRKFQKALSLTWGEISKIHNAAIFGPIHFKFGGAMKGANMKPQNQFDPDLIRIGETAAILF
jgi:hypothetical protein